MGKKSRDADDSIAPWERQPGESGEAWASFCEYRDTTGRRSVRKVCEKQAKSRGIVNRWCIRWKWVERALAWDDEVDRVGRNAFLKTVEKHAKLHADLAQMVIVKAAKKLEKVDAEKLTNRLALAYTQVGVRLHREAIELERVRRDRELTQRALEREVIRLAAAQKVALNGGQKVSSDPSRRPWHVEIIGAEQGKDPLTAVREAVGLFFDKPRADEPLIPNTGDDDDDVY